MVTHSLSCNRYMYIKIIRINYDINCKFGSIGTFDIIQNN